MTPRAGALLVAVALAFLSACAGRPPVEPETDMAAWSWGGYGASSGWRQFQLGEDGILRVDEFRRETGAIFLVIPLRFKSDSHMRFLPAADGCELTR